MLNAFTRDDDLSGSGMATAASYTKLTNLENHQAASDQAGARERNPDGSPASSQPLRKAISHRPAPNTNEKPLGLTRSMEPSSRSMATATVVTWAPRAHRHVPWLAFLALITVVLCIGAAVILLEVANGQVTRHWKFAPTVYLAILSTIANICLSYAFSKGAVICWWRSALLGSTVEGLSEVWRLGDTLSASLLPRRSYPGPRAHKLAFASVMITIVLINGPLFQRALGVTSHGRNSTITMLATIAPQVPGDYTADVGARSSAFTPSDDYVAVVNQYNRRTGIRSPFNTTCDGSCNAEILAGGVALRDCTEFTTPYDTSRPGPDYSSGMTNKIFKGFVVDVGRLGSDEDSTAGALSLQLTVAGPTVAPGTCKGTFTTRWCSLEPSIARYPVSLRNDIVTFNSQIHHPEIVARANATGGVYPQYSTLGGLYSTGQELYHANFAYIMDAVYGWQTANATVFALEYLPKLQKVTETFACPGSFKDPTNDILSAFNEILFRTSIHAGNPQTKLNLTEHPLDPGLSLYQEVQVQQTSTQNVYKTVGWALWSAVAVTGLGVLAVLPTLWGWQEIGADMSLDPIETARAFGAPLLWGATGRKMDDFEYEDLAEKRGILDRLASWRTTPGWSWSRPFMRLKQDPAGPPNLLRYGEAIQEGSAPYTKKISSGIKRLEFSEAQRTLRPGKGERYLR